MNSALRSSLRKSTSPLLCQCRPRQTFRGIKTAPLQNAVSATRPPYILRNESPSMTTPVAAVASKFQRRSLMLGGFALLNIGVGATLYYFVSLSDGQLESSFRKKNGHLDRTKFEGRGNNDSTF